MGIPLAQTQAVSEVASHLYDYLPGSTRWAGTYTFAHAASDCGVPGYWPGGSKLPALTALLEQTLEHSPGSFCPLIETIVRNGIKYRTKKGNALTRADIETLNKLLRRVGFKIPSLWDPGFLSSLPQPRNAKVAEPHSDTLQDDAGKEESRRFSAALAGLLKTFLTLHGQLDRNSAGLALEPLLNEVFALHGLDPNEQFRVVGEQIDGSFLLDSELYLLEAKWTESKIGQDPLNAFRGKVEGKSSFTRGLFISINGFSPPGIQAIRTGKQLMFIMMDGADLYRVLEGAVRLDELLRRKVRHLAERGEPFVSVSQLFGAG